MYWYRFLAGLLIALGMCPAAFPQSAETSLHGRWKIDLEETRADLKGRPKQEELRELAELLGKLNLGFDFRERGTLIVYLAGEPVESRKWRTLKERSPKGIVIEVLWKDETSEGGAEILAELVRKNTMRLTHPDLKVSLIFRRLQEHEQMGPKRTLRPTLPEDAYIETNEVAMP